MYVFFIRGDLCVEKIVAILWFWRQWFFYLHLESDGIERSTPKPLVNHQFTHWATLGACPVFRHAYLDMVEPSYRRWHKDTFGSEPNSQPENDLICLDVLPQLVLGVILGTNPDTD